MSKHTPGPWREWDDGIRGSNGESVCRVYAVTGDTGKRHGRGVSDYNARLIAAAPELLEALRCLTGYAESEWRKTTGGRMNGGTSVPIEHVKMARAAIAKATGGE